MIARRRSLPISTQYAVERYNSLFEESEHDLRDEEEK